MARPAVHRQGPAAPERCHGDRRDLGGSRDRLRDHRADRRLRTFPSIWLAFWWAIQTVTTVGYGDVVPGQASGKAMAAVLMIVGLAFLSVVTATITSVFVARRQAELAEAGKDPVMRRLDEIAKRLEAIDAQLGSRRPDARPPDPPS